MREEGPKGLFKGLTPIMLRAFPANAVSLPTPVEVGMYAMRACSQVLTFWIRQCQRDRYLIASYKRQ